MGNSVIEVTGLSKRYRIGVKGKRSDTFAGRLANFVRSPFENFRQLSNMTKFSAEDDSVFWALKDVEFKVNEGDVLGIIGRNGAGKSTLLKILSRITEPSTGEVVITGRVSSLLEVGTGFHPELTGRENIYMNGTILGMTKREIDRKLEEIIDFSGIEKFVDTPVKFYSSGMKVRLGFSVAAHLEPEILIVDEVLAVGDADFQKKCLGKMKEVSGSGRTVLFVSHSMEAVSALCTRVTTLEHGRVVYDGSTSDGISKYLNYSAQSVPHVIFHRDDLSLDQTGPRETVVIESLKTLFKNEETNVFQLGQRITLELGVTVKDVLNHPEFGVAISTLRGQRLHHLVSSWNGNMERLTPGRYNVRITTDPIRLYPNEYSIALWAKSRIMNYSDHFIESAARIRISKTEDHLSKHFESFNNSGGVFLETEWSVEKM